MWVSSEGRVSSDSLMLLLVGGPRTLGVWCRGPGEAQHTLNTHPVLKQMCHLSDSVTLLHAQQETPSVSMSTGV